MDVYQIVNENRFFNFLRGDWHALFCVAFANAWINTYILTHTHKNANSNPHLRHFLIMEYIFLHDRASSR